jgi:hypothetical protein
MRPVGLRAQTTPAVANGSNAISVATPLASSIPLNRKEAPSRRVKIVIRPATRTARHHWRNQGPTNQFYR